MRITIEIDPSIQPKALSNAVESLESGWFAGLLINSYKMED